MSASARDDRIYIRLHDGMPTHPKVEALSDKSFRVLIELWCWCSQNLTDGAVPEGVWRKRASAKVRAELTDAGLVEAVDGGIVMHDYTLHQRSRSEVDEIRAAKKAGGSIGNHKRWHVDRGVVDDACTHCQAAPVADVASQDRSHMRSLPDRKPSPKTEAAAAATSDVAPPLLPLPPGWWPAEETWTWAEAERPDIDLQDVTARYVEVRTGKGHTSNDWDADYRRWVRRERAAVPLASGGASVVDLDAYRPAAIARPASVAWCGSCEEFDRRYEDEAGRWHKCEVCHPAKQGEPAF